MEPIPALGVAVKNPAEARDNVPTHHRYCDKERLYVAS